MTVAQDFDIVGSYNNQRVQSIDSERSVNMFQYNDPLGKKPKSLINTSGLVDTNSDFGSATKGFRQQYTFLNDQYFVVDDQVYLMSSSGSLSLLGTLQNTDEGYVGIDANTFQVIFVDGVNGYIWDTRAQTFTMITDSSFPTRPIDVCTLDGFFIVAQGNTPNFYLSSLNQGLIWGPASNEVTTNIGALPDQLIIGVSTIGGPATSVNYQTGVPVFLQLGSGGSLAGTGLDTTSTYYAILVDSTHIKLASSYENAIAGVAVTITGNITPIVNVVSEGQLQQGAITTHPGNIVSCRTLHRRLFLFSSFFTEVWENAGQGTNLPFRRNNSLLMEYGTPAIGSVSVGFDIMMFLSQSRDGLGSVMLVTGTGPIPVSTRALDFQLAQYAAAQQVSDCRGFLIKENGLIFYRMNFTEANHTFVYDVTLSDPSSEATMLWHEEEVLNGDRHPAQTHAYFNGKNYVGHYARPILYEISPFVYTNAGELIRRMRIVRPKVPDGYQRIRVDRLQIDLLQGMVEALQPEEVEQSLLTEDNFELTTEDGFDLLLEQDLIIDAPQDLYVFLSISRDGGQSYGYTIKSPMGAVGQRSFRTLWRKLGTIPRGQAFVCKFEFFDAVPFVILGGAWAIEIMPE